jgi:tRNA G18 (ribose-2'-O)-methylase SpoU
MMKLKKITSPNNTTFKTFQKLMRTRGIKKYGMALLSGPKQVREVLLEFQNRCAGIIFSDQADLPFEPTAKDIPSYQLSSNLFREIDLYGTGKPILLVRVEPFLQWDKGTEQAGCTLCVPFQDPVNVGAVIRSAAAFGVSKVVMLKEAAHPFHPKSIRAAGSNIFRVPIFEGPSLHRLKASKVPVIALSPKGENARNQIFPASFWLVPGLEGVGLPDHLMQGTVVSIPMEQGVESLNAALAAGIVLYLWRNRVEGSLRDLNNEA